MTILAILFAVTVLILIIGLAVIAEQRDEARHKLSNETLLKNEYRRLMHEFIEESRRNDGWQEITKT